MVMMEHGYTKESIGIREFPPFVRVTLQPSTRKELFLHAAGKVGTIRREYSTSENVFDLLYGKKKGKILNILSEGPKSARKLAEASGLSPSAVYHFLTFLKERHMILKRGHQYSLGEYDFDSLYLYEIVRLEEDSALRRRYGISIKELELAYFLWNTFLEIASDERGYGQYYNSQYTLADAIHRWKTGRTDIPVWALNGLAELTESGVVRKEGSIIQYHLPPGIPVNPYFDGGYRLPVLIDTGLDRIAVQLLQKISKNNLYTFPKRRRWLFEELHNRFGEFDDSTSRVPSAIVEILKSHYGIETLDRTSAKIPPRMRTRWSDLPPLSRIVEKSSLLLHIISLSSRSNGGFEITSRSKSFLEDLSFLTADLGLGALSVHRKYRRPHFRVYLSESKVTVLRRYARLFQEYPDLEIWSRIPLNQIAEKLVLTDGDCESLKRICFEELSRFGEFILKSLERKKKENTYGKLNYSHYREEITNYFWEQRLIPSPRRVEELVEMHANEEEPLLYV